MPKNFSRRSFAGALTLLAAGAATGSLSACAGGSQPSSSTVRIGTMPTEDILPMWIAERDGMFADAGVEAQVVVFDSAPSLSAAITAGEVDLAMTDPMRSVKLCESGTDVRMEWITLGTEPAQGRFGVLVGPDTGWESLADVATYLATAEVTEEWGFGVAANTVPEYVFDKLCEQAGVEDGVIPKQEVPSLPDRYSLVASGKLEGGAFPGSMLALGEAAGLQVLADDHMGLNISQSVMVVRSAFAAQEGGQDAVEKVREAWDAAVTALNADPEAYRALLVEKANLNSEVADSYPMSEYPLATTPTGGSAHPPAELIEPQLEWMKDRGYSEKDVSYDETDGSFSVA